MSGITEVRKRAEQACRKAGRRPDEVTLIAVSKTQPTSRVHALYNDGQRDFGENKLQELAEKSLTLSEKIQWHFIGGIQRNKIRKILQHADYIHSVESDKTLVALDRISGEEGKRPRIFLQVNIDEEESKGGFLMQECTHAVERALSLENIHLQGLMCIPSPQGDPENTRPSFQKLASLREELEVRFQIKLPSLSMGMSNDYEIAIEEGATHIRVGTALFGTRNYL